MPQRPPRMTDAEFQQLVEDAKARFNITDVAERLGLTLKRAGSREMVALCCFHSEKTPSLRFNDARGMYFCFGCGAFGDVIRFVMERGKMGFMQAVQHLAGSDLPRISPETRIAQRKEEEAERLAAIAEAHGFWRQGRVPRGTPAEAYARSRGITMTLPLSIRFALLPAFRSKKTGEWGKPMPCLMAYVQGGDGGFVGIQRTFLAAGGQRKANMKKPKLSLGRIVGGALRLGMATEELIVCEGWEDGQTIVQDMLANKRTDRSVWVALGTGLLPSIIFPTEVKHVIIASQNNRPASIAAAKAGQNYVDQGKRVSEVRPEDQFDDWNDQLRRITKDDKRRLQAEEARQRAARPKGNGRGREKWKGGRR